MMTEPGYTPANLRALIERSGLTQPAAADMIGVNHKTLRRWLCRRPGQPGAFRHAAAEVARAYDGGAGRSVTLSRSVPSCPVLSQRHLSRVIPVHHWKTVLAASVQHRPTCHARKVPFPSCNPFVEWRYISAVKSVGIALFALKSITSSRMTSPSSYRITAETFQLRGFVQYFAQPFSCLTAPSMPDGRTVNAANGWRCSGFSFQNLPNAHNNFPAGHDLAGVHHAQVVNLAVVQHHPGGNQAIQTPFSRLSKSLTLRSGKNTVSNTPTRPITAFFRLANSFIAAMN